MWLADMYSSRPSPSSSPAPSLSPYRRPSPLPHPVRTLQTVPQSRPLQPPAEAADPLEVLRAVIGKRERVPAGQKKRNKSPAPKATLKKRPVLVSDVPFGELSLEEFAREGEQNQSKASSLEVKAGQDHAQGQKVPASQHQSIESYNDQKQRFQALHDAISSANTTLQSVESYLVRFQTDLGHVSAEIESLQSRSTTLTSQLENRRNLERLLGPAVQNLIVSPACVQAITEGNVDRRFIKALKEVEDRERYISQVEKKAGEGKENATVKAVEDVKPVLQGLRAKATERTRDYLVSQIKHLRAPNVNAQLIQQGALLKNKELFAFIHRSHPQLAGDLAQAYANTMKWYFTSLFQRYIQALEGIKLLPFDKNDLLGVDTAALQKSVFQSQRPTGHDPFTLGRRIDILRTHNNMAISSQLAETDKTAHGIEVPFRNFTLALVDNISAEYGFVSEFFAPALSFHQGSRRVTEIFEHVLSAGQTLIKTLVDNCMDCLGLLLCVRLNQHFAFELQRRRVPVAEMYINGVNMMLWPRFQIVMDMHCDSLRKAAAAAANSGRGAFLASTLLAGSGAESSGAAGASGSSAPHLVTQRFGQFLQGVLMLSNEAGDDEPVSISLGRLRSEYDTLLGKLSKSAAGGDAKRRERFLVNNYSLVLAIISDTQGKLANEQKEHLTQMMAEAAKKR